MRSTLLLVIALCIQSAWAVQSGPVAYYSFDDASTTTLVDSSGNNFNGTYLSAPGRATGQVNSSLTLNGTTQYAQVPHNTALDPTTGWTLSAFVRRTALNAQHSIIEKYAASGGNYAMRISDTNRLQAHVLNYPGNDVPLLGSTPINANIWYHVAATYDSTAQQLKLYVNGNLDGTTAVSFTPGQSPNALLKIGARGDDNSTKFAGNIDEARIYNRALSQAEITALAAQTTPAATMWHLTIPMSGGGTVPPGDVFSREPNIKSGVTEVAVFNEASATINFMELTFTDTAVSPDSRNYDAIGMVHTTNTFDYNTTVTGRIGAGQIGRSTAGFPNVMTFFARKDFDANTFACSTVGNGTAENTFRAPFAFAPSGIMYARYFFFRGDGGTGPTVSNIRMLMNVTCVNMPGAYMTNSNQNIINWKPSPANEAVAQKLYRATAAAGPFSLVQSFAENTTATHTDTTAVAGNTYYYKVVAEAAGGVVGAESNVLSSTFTDTLTVAGMTPAPNSTNLTSLASVVFDFSKPVSAATITNASFLLVRAGTDGLFDTADDVSHTIPPANLLLTTATKVTVSFSGLNLPADKYRISLIGAVKGTTGSSEKNILVPGFGNSLPTGDFTIEFWQIFFGGQFWTPYTFSLNPEMSNNLFRFSSPWNSGPDFMWWDLGSERHDKTNVNSRTGWHHFALVKSGATIQIYWNGVLILSEAHTSPTTPYQADLELPNAGNQPFNGRIDEFRIWNVARSLTQIQTYMKRNLRGNESGLLAYWDFNEGTGTTANDKTGHGFTGTMETPPLWNVSDVPLLASLTDQNGSILDGEFSGTFPSGNTFPGGDFSAQFTLIPPPLKVTAMTPAPNSAIAAQPSSILLTFNNSLTTGINYKKAVVVTRAGTDTALNTGDDVVITPTSVALVGTTQLQVNLPAGLPFDLYQVKLPSLAVPVSVSAYAATSPYNVRAADPSGDGKADLIVTNRGTQNPTVYLGDGAGRFNSTTPLSLFGTTISNISSADINGDGKADLIAGSDGATNTISVSLNTSPSTSNLTFGAVTTFAMGNNCLNVQAADLNGDTKPDLVTSNFGDSSISIRFNTTPALASSPTFSAPTTYSAGGSSRFIAIGDVNGDGKLDIVACNFGASTLSVLLNTTAIGNATPSFSAPGTLNTDSQPYVVQFADINGDGKPDLVVSCYSGNSINVFMNTTATNASVPSFGAKTAFALATSPSYIGVGDLDGDGKVDLVVSCEASNNVGIFVNTTPALATTPSFAASYRISTGTNPTSVVVGDFTGNGDVGFASSNFSGNSLTVAYPFARAVVDAFGNQLDGEFSGTLPSGNGTVGGDFAATFTYGNVGPTTTTVAQPAAIAYGTASLTLAATVTAPGNTVGSGTVTFQLTNGGNVGGPINGTVSAGAASVTYPIPAGTPPGLYTIEATYNGAGAYQNSANSSKQLTINTAALIVTPASSSRSYGSANPTFTGTITGIKYSDNITANYATTLVVTPGSAVGNYQIAATLNDPTGKLSNYTVTLNTGTLTVSKVALSIVAGSVSRAYATANPVFTGNITGLVNGDSVTATYATSATPSSSATTYAIIPTPSDPGVVLGNYNLAVTNGTLTVTKVPLTVVADSFQRAYGAANPVFTGTLSGVVNGDNITATYSTTATVSSSVGNYAIVPALADPNGRLVNYILTSTNGVLNINNTTVLLVVTPNSFSRTYGSANPVFTGTITGILNGDNITANYSAPANILSGAGNYVISATLTDPNNRLQNYTVNANVGQLAVTKASLSVTGGGFSRLYGAANPALSGAIVGIKNGDNITASYATSATAVSPVNAYPVVPTMFDPGNKLANYNLTVVNGSLNVTAAPLTVTPANAGRAYAEANPVFTGTVSGVLNGDGIGATYSTTATVSSPVGMYPITAAVTDPNSKAGNYSITLNTGTLSISTAPAITVTPGNASRLYGAANPAFTGTLTGVLNGDNITAQYSTTATPATAIGNYQITAGLLDPDNKVGNYAVVTNVGTLSIGAAPLSVTPADASRTYGSANPTFTGTITGLQNDDAITASYTTAATPANVAGTYLIAATLADPDIKLGNYILTQNAGTLTITPAPITVTIADVGRSYHAPEPLLTGTIAGIQNNDEITALYFTSAGFNSPAGTYAITTELADPFNVLPNYMLTVIGGTLTISRAIPVLTWQKPARIFAGVPLGNAQLNAAAADPFTNTVLTGTFTYSPGTGTVLGPGPDQDLSVSFQPDDAANYAAASAKNTIDIDPAVAVTITSALSAASKRHEAFSYVITADGTAPMTFSAEALPAGLTLSGDTISGNPAVTGVFFVVLKATNFAGSDSKTLKLIVTQSGNNAPVFASAPIATPNPSVVGAQVLFSGQATDLDGDALDYGWDFGDATFGSGATASKIYSAAGVYSVKLTVFDGQAFASQTINVAVNESATVDKMTVEKIKLAFNFTKAGKDSLSISGSLPLPAGFAPAGKSVRVMIAGLDYSGTLTSKGATSVKAFKLKIKPNEPRTSFSLLLGSQNLYQKLEPLGISKFASNPRLEVPVIVVLDGIAYSTNSSIKYTIKSSAKGPQSARGELIRP